MLRVHFTSEDVARTRLVVLGPLTEAQFGLRILQRQDRPALFGKWRAHASRGFAPEWAALARFLAAPGVGMVDLFTVVEASQDLEEGLNHIRESGTALRQEIGLVRTMRPRWPVVPAMMHRLLDGDREAVDELVVALRGIYRSGIAPYWQAINTHLHVRRTADAARMAEAGLEGMLPQLHSSLRWCPPVLEVAGYRPFIDPTDFHLQGRGLLLAPSLYCTTPLIFTAMDSPRPTLLIYPALPDPVAIARIWTPGATAHRSLNALLGSTRSAVLEAIADRPMSTTDLAGRLGFSISGASHHTKVLRDAGLIATLRDGNRVLHVITPLGTALGNGAI
ncbi:ArsR/SmtB family transcription factor [Nonomuraea sp. LPB2021202275-12-8]|uniref:ArsR/SmtB family transcription factor n=1 Tax=Nonomuraea sp. LPB2021202275-12-8 TaxID=3120159 RepID=UPI00300CC6EE